MFLNYFTWKTYVCTMNFEEHLKNFECSCFVFSQESELRENERFVCCELSPFSMYSLVKTMLHRLKI